MGIARIGTGASLCLPVGEFRHADDIHANPWKPGLLVRLKLVMIPVEAMQARKVVA
jgi:hypothetical protein